MDNQDYVIDEKRNLAWGSRSEALDWYRSRVTELEAFLDTLKHEENEFYSSAIELNPNRGPNGLDLHAELMRLRP